MSWKPLTIVSGQSLSSRMATKINNPKGGPPPADNGTNTLDLVPNKQKLSRSRPASAGRSDNLAITIVSPLRTFLLIQGKDASVTVPGTGGIPRS